MSKPVNPLGTLRTPEHHRELYEHSVLLLRAVRESLATMLEDALTDPGEPKAVAAKQAELEIALRRAMEAEARWNAVAPDGSDVATIDFDAIRQELACKLQQVRPCCHD